MSTKQKVVSSNPRTECLMDHFPHLFVVNMYLCLKRPKINEKEAGMAGYKKTPRKKSFCCRISDCAAEIADTRRKRNADFKDLENTCKQLVSSSTTGPLSNNTTSKAVISYLPSTHLFFTKLHFDSCTRASANAVVQTAIELIRTCREHYSHGEVSLYG